MMNHDNEPFRIHEVIRSPENRRNSLQERQIGLGETKIEDKTPILNDEDRFDHGGNLRRRSRRRNDIKEEETKVSVEETKYDDLHAGGTEESKQVHDISPHKPSRLRKSIPASAPQPRGNEARASLPVLSQPNYIRKPPDEKLREKFNKNKMRIAADNVPEVHFIGEVVEGVGFKDSFVSCKWYLEWGRAWSLLEGDESSQTQYSSSEDGVQVWNHPIDVHFASASIQGWPRMVVQVWELDEFGRSILAGYGFVHLPTNPGYHELDIHCWRPSGSIGEELRSFFLGTTSCLVDEDIIFGKAWENRSQISTISSGIVKLDVTVLLRFLKEQHVD